MAPVVEMRGAAFLSFFDAVRELRDDATATRVCDALPPPLRERFVSGALTRIGWYPMADYSRLHTAANEVLGGGHAFARQLGRVTTEQDTRGLLRYVLAFASPELLMRYADKVVMSYVRGARCHSERIAARHSMLHVEDFHGASELVHQEWIGGVQILVERCGGKTVSVSLVPTAIPAAASFEVRWT